MSIYLGLEDEHGLKFELEIDQSLEKGIYIKSIVPIKPEFPRDRIGHHKMHDALTENEKALFNELYMILWTEAYYDPSDKQIEEFCKPLSDIMTKLNKTLKFKE